ncbi:MAG: GyrI-like domain-containing protein [bacterium]
MKISFELKQLPGLHVACARNVGPYNTIGRAFERLSGWAGPLGLMGRPDVKVLAVYHDDPEKTRPEDLRADACVTIPPGTAVGGDVATMTVPGGLFAVAHAEIAPTEFGAAWNKLLCEWLPQSGFQPDDRMCYEVYLNDHEQHPEKRFIVDICEPVKPA